jgi:hypothetical protein
MKLKNLSLAFVCLYFAMAAQAKIWRINNSGVPADYTTAQAANDAAAVVNGDTLHFEPSGINYGNLTLSKRLIVIGNGYFVGTLATNNNPGLQANTATSKLNDIFTGPGANNSVIMGLQFNSFYLGSNGNSQGIVLKRNNLSGYVYTYSSSNCLVIQNFIGSGINAQGGGSTNLVISNNIVNGYMNMNASSSGVCTNNVFTPNSSTGHYMILTGFAVRNNIMAAADLYNPSSFTACTIENNLSASTQFGNTNGNLQSVAISTVFVGYPTIGSNSSDGRFALASGSPAAGTGFGGSDMGAILRPSNTNNNMADTYVLSGMPNVPSIFRFTVPTTVTGSSMSITISTKTND